MGNCESVSQSCVSRDALNKKSCALLKEWLGESEEKITGGVELSVSGGDDDYKGGSVVFGGGSKIADYAESIYSKQKEKLIRNIAEEVFKALKLQGAKYAQTADISAVVGHLKKVVPNPRSSKPFNSNFTGPKQKQVCDVLAEAINHQYGSKMIDMNADVGAKCKQISEVMYSLLLGLHTEFMSVAGDVVTVLKNMQTLREFIKASYDKQKELVAQSGNELLQDQSNSTAELFERVLGELDRQMAIIGNVMNVSVSPAGKELIGLLMDNKEFKGMVGDLKSGLGADNSRKIAYMLSGVSSVAHSASVLQRELKKIGVSVNEFKNSKNLGELRAKLYAAIQKKSPTSKELDKLMRAYNVIMNHTYDHAAVSKAIKGGGDEEDVMGGGDEEDDVMGGDDFVIMGGDDEDDRLPLYWSKKSLIKKIKDKKKFRGMILKEFRNQLMALYKQIAVAGDSIARNIGSSIPVSEELDIFIRQFAALPTLDQDSMPTVLSGYSVNAADNSERESFLSKYRSVESLLSSLSKGAGGAVFKPMQNAIARVVKEIDTFKDTMVNAITEITPDRPEEVSKLVRSSVADVYGSGDAGVYDNGFVTFKKVQNDLSYYYSIATIKENLKRVSTELKTYGDDYETVLGEEAGWLINSIRKEYNTELECLQDGSTKDTMRSGAIRQLAGNKQKATLSATRAFLERQRDAKIKMVEVAQAVDLYLKEFTNGVANHPDSVKSIIKMLDQVDIVANWFNERSGDNLAALMEVFPREFDNNNVEQYSTGGIINEKGDLNSGNFVGNGHYYDKLAGLGPVLAGGGLPLISPGIPTLGRPVVPATDDADQINVKKNEVNSLFKLSTKAVHSMRALENILSAFKNVGEKFGDLNPQSHTFMNPGQIFNALTEYIACSSFSNEFASGSELTVGAGPSTFPSTQIQVNGALVPNVVPADAGRLGTAGTRATGADTSALAILSFTSKNIQEVDSIPKTTGNKSGVTVNQRNDAESMARKYTSVAMASIQPVGFGVNKWDYHDTGTRADYTNEVPRNTRLDVAGWRDDFYDTDLLFEMTMKSIVAKVFTVVDAYRLFNRPTVDRKHRESINPLRVIMGGDETDGGDEMAGGAMKTYVKVQPELAELYLRLPLLAEWYRDMFGLERNANPPQTGPNQAFVQNNNVWVASMVPAVDGVWSKLINIVFDKANYVNSGNYTETIVQELIEAINEIDHKYKTKGKASTRDIMNAFVMEMNRVFGFLRTKEIQDYLADRRSNRDTTLSAEEERKYYLDYDILDAKNQYSRNAAPSDKFIDVGITKTKRDQRVMVHLQKAIVDLRTRMDVDLTKNSYSNGATGMNPSADTRFSFVDSVRNYVNDIKNAPSEQDKYKVVLGMLQNNNKLVNVNISKLIMVHESIAAPLTALQRAVNVAWKFNNMVHGLNMDSLDRWSEARNGSNETFANDMGVGAADNNALHVAAIAWFRREYPELATNDECKQAEAFADELCGYRGQNTTGYMRTAVGDARAGQGARIAVNNVASDRVIRDLLGAILDLGQDPNKLVQVDVGTTGIINVDFSGLQELCEELLSLVKKNINNMRSEFKNLNLLNKYSDVKYHGSTSYIETRMNLLFKDTRKSGLGVGVGEKLSACLKFMNNGVGGLRRNNLGNVLSGLVFYELGNNNELHGPSQAFMVNDLTTFPFNVIPMKVSAQELTANQKAQIPGLTAGTVAAGAAVGGNPANSINAMLKIPIIQGMGPADIKSYMFTDPKDTSLITAFNRLVHYYMRDNLETGLNKVYLPLFESFMNGAGAAEVVQLRGYPNIRNIGAMAPGANFYRSVNNADLNTNTLGGPPENAVLWNSNGLAMQSLANELDTRTKKRRFIYETLTEAPEFMKDRMRCNLPYYSKLFDIVQKRASLLRDVFNNVELCKNKCAVNAGANRTAFNTSQDGQPALVNLQLKGANSAEYAKYLSGLCQHTVELALDLNKCINKVYKELQDVSPMFMGVTRDFINDYKQRNGAKPLMPASNVLLPSQKAMTVSLKNVLEDDDGMLLLPTDRNGSRRYKFNYASRLLLARSDVEPSMDHMPGAKELYNEYASSNGKHNLSIQDYAKTVLLMVKLARFLNDGTYSRLFGKRSSVLSNACVQDIVNNGFMSIFNVLTAGGAIVLDKQTQLNNASTRAVDGVYASSSPYMGMSDSVNELLERWARRPANAQRQAYATYLLQKVGGAPMAANICQQYNTDAFNPSSNQSHIDMELLANRTMQSALPNPTDAISLSENPSIKSNKEKLAKYIDNATSVSGADRRSMRTYNILDMNIVPLNVHAFMREVPFVNILNYSYTFDRMVHDFVLPDYVSRRASPAVAPAQTPEYRNTLAENNLMIACNDATFSTRGLMVKLLVHPWAMLNRREYYGVLGAMFNGNDNMKLGRPRYLSDQLWGKVLLTSAASPLGINNENGITASEAQRQVLAMSGAFNGAPQVYNPNVNFLAPHVRNDNLGVGPPFLPQIESSLFDIAQLNQIHQNYNGVGGLDNMPDDQDTMDNFRTLIEYPVQLQPVCDTLDNIGSPLQPPERLWNAINSTGVMGQQHADIRDAFGELRKEVVKAQEVLNVCTTVIAPFVRRIVSQQFNPPRPVGAGGYVNTIATNITGNNLNIPTYTDVIRRADLEIDQPVVALPRGAPPADWGAQWNAVKNNIMRVIAPNVQARSLAAEVNETIANNFDGNNYTMDNRIAPQAVKQDVARAANGPLDVPANAGVGVAVAAAIGANPGTINNGGMAAVKALETGLAVMRSRGVTDDMIRLITMMVEHCITGGTIRNLIIRIRNYSAVLPNSLDVSIIELFVDAVVRLLRPANTNANACGLTALVSLFGPAASVMNIGKLVNALRANNKTVAPPDEKSQAYSISGQNPVITNTLKYLKGGKWQDAPGIRDAGNMLFVADVGYTRFNTKLIRNLTWMVQLQRLMRVIMVDHLDWMDSPVVQGLKIANPDVTEFNGNESWDEKAYDGTNYELI